MNHVVCGAPVTWLSRMMPFLTAFSVMKLELWAAAQHVMDAMCSWRDDKCNSKDQTSNETQIQQGRVHGFLQHLVSGRTHMTCWSEAAFLKRLVKEEAPLKVCWKGGDNMMSFCKSTLWLIGSILLKLLFWVSFVKSLSKIFSSFNICIFLLLHVCSFPLYATRIKGIVCNNSLDNSTIHFDW